MHYEGGVIEREEFFYRKFRVYLYCSKEGRTGLNWKACIYVPKINGRVGRIQAMDKQVAIHRVKRKIDGMNFQEAKRTALEKVQKRIERNATSKNNTKPVLLWEIDQWLQGKIGGQAGEWDGYTTYTI